jgi:bis(5'-adenosyl)-triphosphatase
MSKANSSDCPFCRTNIHETVFAESENFRAIYNIAPILPGHSMIIPKRHLQSLMDLSDSELCEMMIFGRDVVRILLRAFDAAAFNWTIQEGEEAGQTVPHLHIHLIPRKSNDLPQPGDWYPLLRKSQLEVIDSDSRPRLTPHEMKEIVSRIKQVAEELEEQQRRA